MSKNGESSVVTKCANMVDILALSQQPLSFSELANRSGLVKSSAHRILAVLISERLASYDEKTKTYSLGPRPLTWAKSFLRRSNLPNIADRYFDEFCQRSGMNGALSVRDRGDVLYLRTYDPVPIKISSLAGDRAPLHCTAAGKVLLAFLPETKKDELLANIDYQAFTEFTIKDSPALDGELTSVRAAGYSTAMQEEIFQVLGVAAPVFGENNEVLAAISLWSQIDRVSRAEITAFAQPLQEMAQRMALDHSSGKI